MYNDPLQALYMGLSMGVDPSRAYSMVANRFFGGGGEPQFTGGDTQPGMGSWGNMQHPLTQRGIANPLQQFLNAPNSYNNYITRDDIYRQGMTPENSGAGMNWGTSGSNWNLWDQIRPENLYQGSLPAIQRPSSPWSRAWRPGGNAYDPKKNR